jgi:hypothetical protein
VRGFTESLRQAIFSVVASQPLVYIRRHLETNGMALAAMSSINDIGGSGEG